MTIECEPGGSDGVKGMRHRVQETRAGKVGKKEALSCTSKPVA